MIATKHDLSVLLDDASSHDAALAHLQCLMDERYQHDAAGVWGVVEPNGLTRLGLTAAEAVEMGAVDRVVGEPAYSGPTLEQSQAARILAATAACDAVLAPFGAEYGAWETATFDQQYSEAQVYQSSSTADVPLLAAMCVTRGISIAELAGKIIANRAAWVALTGYVIGQRQRIVGLIEKCGSPEEVAAVDMTISLPTPN